jgi:hypothetical protein
MFFYPRIWVPLLLICSQEANAFRLEVSGPTMRPLDANHTQSRPANPAVLHGGSPSFDVVSSTVILSSPAPELTPFDFNMAPCPGMMSEFSKGWVACEARKQAEVTEKMVRTQADANDLLHVQAVCLCNYTYSPLKPHVQVFLGRCRSWVPSKAERDSMLKYVRECTDSDYAGLAIDAGLALESDGQVGTL